MKKVWLHIVSFFLIPLLLAFPLSSVSQAATIRSGEEIRISETETNLDNLYLFGGSVTVDAPVANELTVGGGEITVNGPIEGSVLIGGGNIMLQGPVGNNARVGGGDVTIDGPIANDLVVTGGNITLTKNASVGGDILFAGGRLQVDGPVEGKIQAYGGEVSLNNSVGQNVEGQIEELRLGSTARIAGNLSYKSPEKAQIDQGAVIIGQTNYQPGEKERNSSENAAGFLAGAAFYKLVADILISLLLVYFFRGALLSVLDRMRASPVKSGAIGFAFFILAPIATLLLFILVWLGIGSALFTTLAMIVSLFIVKIFLGWGILTLIQNERKQKYMLDWKAAVIGPIAVFLLMIVPILGWIAFAVIYLMSLGALLLAIVQLINSQKALTPSKHK